MMLIEDADFEQVVLNSYSPNPCSPALPNTSSEEMAIQAPRRIVFRRSERRTLAIPICGCLRLRGDTAYSREDIRLVVVNQRAATVSVGPFEEPLGLGAISSTSSESEELPPEPPDATTTMYFNPNLPDWAPIPPTTATYDVYLSLDDLRSNVVTIDVIEKIEEDPLSSVPTEVDP